MTGGPAAAERAETYLRLLAEAELREALTPPAEAAEPEAARHEQAGTLVHAGRLPRAASALAALGVIDPDTAAEITEGLAAALAVRGRLGLDTLVHPIRRQVNPPRPVPALPHGVRAVPVGRTLTVTGADGSQADLYVACLVRTEGAVMIAVEVRAPTERTQAQELTLPLSTMRITDDLGTSYQDELSFLSQDGRADGWLFIHNPPRIGVRWLEMDSGPGTARLRMDPAVGAEPAPARWQPAGATGPGERLLDSIAGDLLAGLPDRRGHGEHLGELVAALEAAGAVPPGNPASGRLATLCERAGLGAGGDLVARLAAGDIARADLPRRWISVLDWFAHPHREAGLRGFAPAGLALLELDGFWFVIVGLTAEPDRMGLRVLVIGRPDEYPWTDGRSWAGWFPWWVKDPGGQWHVAALDGRRQGYSGHMTVDLRLVPPLVQPVTRLDVHIPGRTHQMSASVPLEWGAPDG
jgi:hypothetical protein